MAYNSGLLCIGMPGMRHGQPVRETAWVYAGNENVCPGFPGKLKKGTGRVLSIVRYGIVQYGDVIRWVQGDQGPELAPKDGLVQSWGTEVIRLYGTATTRTTGMYLTEIMREIGIHIEVWSLTMRSDQGPQPSGPESEVPFRAGIAYHESTNKKDIRLIADVLECHSRERNVSIYSPRLMQLCGYDLNVHIHRRAMKKLGIKEE